MIALLLLLLLLLASQEMKTFSGSQGNQGSDGSWCTHVTKYGLNFDFWDWRVFWPINYNWIKALSSRAHPHGQHHKRIH